MAESTRQPGDRLGAHELVRKIGSGGMGEVWEAVLHGPAGFQKVVAIKLLHAGPTEREQASLVREARLGARLQHPNLVSVLGLGEADGVWYVVMELVRGQSAAQLVRDQELPAALVLDIGLQAGAGLAHIHGLVVDDRPAGLVHCDIKPENLLVDGHGIVRVADLGIASLAGERGRTAGTLGYMAPEQLDGSPEARSDLFALGATLYVLTVRQRPFERTLRGLVGLERRIAEPSFTAPVDARIPGLGDIVRRCLRLDPRDRYTSAAELVDALGRLRVDASTPRDIASVLREQAPTLAPAGAQTTFGSGSGPANGNVVRPPDAFVGRAAEVAALRDGLRAGHRLVTLVAMGGTGKTRLATEVALVVGDDFDGGAWMLVLEEARGAEEVCGAIASQLGVALTPADHVAQVGSVFASRRSALFVLDNVEQCVDAVRRLLPQWMASAPDAQFLVTSRIPLKIRGERPVNLGALTAEDAAELFLERAPVVLPADQSDAVAATCDALDRVPLAIELAAARLRAMTLSQMRERMGLRLLAGGSDALPDRQRSIEASIRWSWDLLGLGPRAALAQLSVFAGGFTLAAAEAVLDDHATAGGWAIDVVQTLCEASLLRLDPSTERFAMLSVVRAFAGAHLDARARDLVEARHGAFFAQLGAPGALERLRVPLLAPDLDNVVAATRSAARRRDPGALPSLLSVAMSILDRVGPHELVAELAEVGIASGALGPDDRARVASSAFRNALVTGRPADAERFHAVARESAAGSTDPKVLGSLRSAEALAHRLAGRRDDAEAAYAEAIAHLEPVAEPVLLARVWSSRGGLSYEAGRLDEARTWFERSLRLRRAAGDRQGEAMDRANLANIDTSSGRDAEALEHQQAALLAYREVGDSRGVAQITGDIGLSLHNLGRADEAERSLRTALALHRRWGNRRFEGIVASNLGMHLSMVGRFDEARAHLERALELHRALNNRRSEGIALHHLAKLHLGSGAPEAAANTAREALVLLQTPHNPQWVALIEALLADAERALSAGRT